MSAEAVSLPQPVTRRGSKHPSFFRRTPYRISDWHDAELLKRARDYMRPVKPVRRAATTVSFALAAALVLLRLGPVITGGLRGVPWPLQLLAVLVVSTLISTIVNAPFGYWFEMVHDKRWGFTTQGLGTWVGDLFKSLGIGVVLNALLLGLIYWLIHVTPAWWLYAGIGAGFLTLLFTFVFPVLILPLFFKQKPVEGELKARIDRVAALAGMTVDKAFVMDASSRSTRDNAQVAGAGKTKRVIVFDTILEHPGYVLDNVLAHELGHYRLKHIAIQVPFAMALSILQFGAIALVAASPAVLSLAGIGALRDPASLPLFEFITMVLGLPLGLMVGWFSRVLERQADLEALELLGDPGAFIDLWHRLTSKNLGDLEPTWYQRAKGSHPVNCERMAFGKAWAEMNGVAIVEPAETEALGAATAEAEPDSPSAAEVQPAPA